MFIDYFQFHAIILYSICQIADSVGSNRLHDLPAINIPPSALLPAPCFTPFFRRCILWPNFVEWCKRKFRKYSSK